MKTLKKLVLLALAILVTAPAFAADNWAGKITEIKGQVTVVRSGQRLQGKLGTVVIGGDEIAPGPASIARIYFRDESTITLAEKSRFRIDALEYKSGETRRSYFSLITGKAKATVSGWFSKSDDSQYQIKALSTVAGVRGTEFVVEVKGEGADASATFAGLSGTVVIWDKDNPDVKVELPAKYILEVLQGRKPGQPKPFDDAMLEAILEGLGLDSTSRENRDDLILALGKLTFPPLGHGGGSPEGFNPDDTGGGDTHNIYNPAELIFQEPPGFTNVEIIINVTRTPAGD
jgi:hypothetical protein